MADIKLFLSTVSAEFRNYREALRHALDRPNVTVKIQEDFIITGTPTLEMLDDYIKSCDGVIHLVGDMTGSMARPQSLAAMRERYPAMGGRLPPIASHLESDALPLSYTQWEALLALLHGRKLFIAVPAPEAPRDGDYALDHEQQTHQAEHLHRLRQMERYPGVTFTSADHLAREVLRSFVIDELVQAEVRQALAQPSPAISGWVWPRPWDYNAYFQEKRRHFTGRRWLFDQVRSWHRNPEGAQALLIEADFGVGKSAFMAELCTNGAKSEGLPIVAHHFCDQNDPRTLEPATFVRSLAAQLALALPAYKEAVESDPAAQEWLDQAPKDVASAFSQAVLSKLAVIEAPPTTLLLLLDGLDETLGTAKPTPNNLPSSIILLLASSTTRLPVWLRLLATSRPRRQEVRARLRQAFSCQEVDAEQAANLNDIRDYAVARCRSEPLLSLLAAAGQSPDLVADLLRDRSGGKFLYAVRVLNDLANGSLAADRLEDFPPGMDGFYLDSFQRRFPDPTLYASIQPLLGLLCVAQEPLDPATLAAIIGVEESSVKLLLRIEDFLRITPKGQGPPGITSPTFAFDHLSLAQWLTDEDEEGFLRRAGDFAVEASASQIRITEWAKQEVAAGRAHKWPYLTRHIDAHLDTVAREDVFASLLVDLCWLEARLRWSGLNALLMDFGWVKEPWLKALERAIRQGGHVLINHPEQLPSQLLARWQSTNNQPSEEERLRQQAATRLLETGSACPLTASLKNREALIRTLNAGVSVGSLAVFPDGQLASGHADGTIRLWDPATGGLRASLEGHTGWVRALVVLPDGRLASGSDDGTIKLWDLATNACGASIGDFDHPPLALELVNDGCLASSHSNEILLWELKSGTITSTLTGHRYPVISLSLLRDGRLVSTSGGGEILLWDLRSNISDDSTYGMVHCMTVFPNERIARWDSYTRKISIWDFNSGTAIKNLEEYTSDPGFPVIAMAAITDRRLAFAAESLSNNCPIKIWDVEHGTQVNILEGHRGNINVMLLLQNDRLASASSDGTIKIWDLKSGSGATPLETSDGQVSALATISNTLIASASTTLRDTGVYNHISEIGLFEIPRELKIASIGGSLPRITDLLVLSSGCLASGHNDGTVVVWDLQSRSVVVELKEHQGASRIKFSSLPGGLFASADDRGKVCIWDKRLNLKHSFRDDFGYIKYLCTSDGLLAGECGGAIRLWDPITGDLVSSIGHGYHALCLIALSNGRLALGCPYGIIKIFDKSNGECTASYCHDSSDKEGIALVALQDGRLISGGYNSTIRLWDTSNVVSESGRLIFYADSAITAFTLNHNASLLVAGDEFGRLHWLKLPT